MAPTLAHSPAGLVFGESPKRPAQELADRSDLVSLNGVRASDRLALEFTQTKVQALSIFTLRIGPMRTKRTRQICRQTRSPAISPGEGASRPLPIFVTPAVTRRALEKSGFPACLDREIEEMERTEKLLARLDHSQPDFDWPGRVVSSDAPPGAGTFTGALPGGGCDRLDFGTRANQPRSRIHVRVPAVGVAPVGIGGDSNSCRGSLSARPFSGNVQSDRGLFGTHSSVRISSASRARALAHRSVTC